MPRLISCLLLVAVGCGSQEDPASQDLPFKLPPLGSGVVVIEIDAWRRDHLSLYGYGKPTTPNLDAWSREALVFEDAWSTGSGVLPATASLLSGCDALLSRHPGIALKEGGVVQPAYPWQFPRDMPLLAFEFLANDWSTALFDSTGEVNELRGVFVGFETLGQPVVPGAESALTHTFPTLTKQWLQWLGEQETGSNWFSYWHVSDLEAFVLQDTIPEELQGPESMRYELPVSSGDPAFHALPRSRVAPHLHTLADYVGAYDTALVRLDAHLQQFFEVLEERGLLGRTTVILVGGYGMGFGEGGLYADAGTLSEVDLAVPMIIRPARDLGLEGGRRLKSLVSLVDVAPTALELARLPVPDGMQGRSMRPIWRMGEPIRQFAYALPMLHSGFAVVDERGMFLHNEPAVGGPEGLATTWFGGEMGSANPVVGSVETLLERGEGLLPFAFRNGIKDEDWARGMRAQGFAWKSWGTALAGRIHPQARSLPSLEEQAINKVPGTTFACPPWAEHKAQD